jgi:hypothetical protein
MTRVEDPLKRFLPDYDQVLRKAQLGVGFPQKGVAGESRLLFHGPIDVEMTTGPVKTHDDVGGMFREGPEGFLAFPQRPYDPFVFRRAARP